MCVYMRTPTARVLRPVLSLSPTHRVVQTLSSLYSLARYFSLSLPDTHTHTYLRTSIFVRTSIGTLSFPAPYPNIPTKMKLSNKSSVVPLFMASLHIQHLPVQNSRISTVKQISCTLYLRTLEST